MLRETTMNPYVVQECQMHVPNPYALTLAAAWRARALSAGAEPRLDLPRAVETELALHEIAEGLFDQEELSPFLVDGAPHLSIGPASSSPALSG